MRDQDELLVLCEFDGKSGSSTGRHVSELIEYLEKNNICHTHFFFRPGKYKPGGLALHRIVNLLVMHLWTPFLLLGLRLKTLFSGHNLAVLVVTTPPLLHWNAQFFGLLLGTPVITWYMDAHPELEAKMFERKGLSLLARLLRLKDKILMCLPRFVIVLDETMKNLVERNSFRSPKMVIVPPWETYLEPSTTMRDLKNKSQFHVLYAGNYGYAHDMSPFVEMLKKESAETLGRIHFTFVGMNAQSAERIRSLFEGIAVKTEFLPRFEKFSDLTQYMRTVDFGIVSLNREFTGIMCPSKAYTYLSQGTPILYVGSEFTLSWELCQQGWGCTDSDFLDAVRQGIAPRTYTRANQHFPNPKEDSLNIFAETVLTVFERAPRTAPHKL